MLYFSNNLRKAVKSPSKVDQNEWLLKIDRSFAIILFPLEVCPIRMLYF